MNVPSLEGLFRWRRADRPIARPILDTTQSIKASTTAAVAVSAI
jgi:hypothetical protein